MKVKQTLESVCNVIITSVLFLSFLLLRLFVVFTICDFGFYYDGRFFIRHFFWSIFMALVILCPLNNSVVHLSFPFHYAQKPIYNNTPTLGKGILDTHIHIHTHTHRERERERGEATCHHLSYEPWRVCCPHHCQPFRGLFAVDENS